MGQCSLDGLCFSVTSKGSKQPASELPLNHRSPPHPASTSFLRISILPSSPPGSLQQQRLQVAPPHDPFYQ